MCAEAQAILTDIEHVLVYTILDEDDDVWDDKLDEDNMLLFPSPADQLRELALLVVLHFLSVPLLVEGCCSRRLGATKMDIAHANSKT